MQEADALLVDGGDATYLAYWMRRSGLVDLLPTLTDTVWVGISAGSMMTTPCVGDEFIHWTPPLRATIGSPSELQRAGHRHFGLIPHRERLQR